MDVLLVATAIYGLFRLLDGLGRIEREVTRIRRMEEAIGFDDPEDDPVDTDSIEAYMDRIERKTGR